MPRPKSKRHCVCKPCASLFKPKGIPLKKLNEVTLGHDELEAMKLHDHDGLSHTEAAEKMGVSQPTFGRILNKAYQKVAEALVEGKAIKIEEDGCCYSSEK